MICFDELDSPLGQLTVVVDEGQVVVIAMADQAHLPNRATFGTFQPGCAATVALELEQYFAGTRTTFSPRGVGRGTAFERDVWTALLEIPYGQTTTYGAIAQRIGRPKAVRAVGGAIGRNPLSIVVPCHRVIGASGNLTGYAGGLDRKRFLLRHEGLDV
jgi:methylated-DNA-[protein]-cysteine S-methyltransferase